MRLTCLFSVDWLKTSPAASSCTRSSLMPRTSFYAGRPHYHVCCTAITKTLKFCGKWNNIQTFWQPQWIAGLFYVVLCEATQEKQCQNVLWFTSLVISSKMNFITYLFYGVTLGWYYCGLFVIFLDLPHLYCSKNLNMIILFQSWFTWKP